MRRFKMCQSKNNNTNGISLANWYIHKIMITNDKFNSNSKDKKIRGMQGWGIKNP